MQKYDVGFLENHFYLSINVCTAVPQVLCFIILYILSYLETYFSHFLETEGSDQVTKGIKWPSNPSDQMNHQMTQWTKWLSELSNQVIQVTKWNLQQVCTPESQPASNQASKQASQLLSCKVVRVHF